MSTAYIIDTKPEPLYTSPRTITGEAYAITSDPYGSGDYASVVYPTGAVVVYPYTP